ncbi:MAG: NTP transferase domain-containing protein [Dehalococcoidia bacterium]
MTVAALLLAAGASRRMGSPKPLLPWGDCTLIEWEYAQLMASCVDDIVVVCGSRAERVRRVLGHAEQHIVFNARWPQGRATSLAAGAMALLRPGREAPAGPIEAIVIQNVDQPTRTSIIDRLVEARRADDLDVVQPGYEADDGKAHGGHPVVVAGRLLTELSRVTDATYGLRAVLERHPPVRVPFERDPAVWIDLDTPDLVPEARRVFGIRE